MFRAFRILLLLLLFSLAVTSFFLDKIGLPEFVKQRLVEQLRAKGWEVDFSRLRLRWYRGIVADDLHLRRTNGFAGPNLFVPRAECGLNFRAFTKLKLDVDSFKLNGGRLIWPIARRDAAQPAFTLNNVAGEVYFRPNDQWDLHFLHGELLGARVRFSGTITNGSLIRDWRFAERKPRRLRRDPVDVWEDLVRTAAQLRFGAQPELDGIFRGDAADLRSFDANLKFKVPEVASPWGAGTNVLLTARLFPNQADNDFTQADFALTATEMATPWVEASDLRLNLEVEPRYTNAWPTNINLAVEFKTARTRWGTGEYALVTTRLRACPTNSALVDTELKAMVKGFKSNGRTAANMDIKLLATHGFTNWLPAEVTLIGDLSHVTSEWGRAGALNVRIDSTLPERTNWFLLNTNLSWLERTETLPVRADMIVSDFSGPKGEAERISMHLDWQSPHLEFKSDGALYGGQFAADGQLQTETRELNFSGHSSFDVHRIAPFLSTNAQQFLKSYSWQTPPKLRAAGRLTLPPWTNGLRGDPSDIVKTLSVAGEFNVSTGAYKGVTFSAAQAPFTFTNDIWRIDPLTLKRPEGDLVGAYTSHPATKEFHWKVRSRIDPFALKPLFTKESEQRVFDLFEFTEPPFVEGEISGHWRLPERLGVNARVHGRNFKFRGESIGDCTAHLKYTNLFLAILNPQVLRPGEKGVASGVAVDFKGQRVWITNAFGNLNPHAVARCISRKTGELLEGYIFDRSPTVRVNGSVDLKKGSDEDDLHFEVSGGVFHWRDFHFQQISGNIEWIGRTMVMTNVQGVCHDGRASGYAHFVFPRKLGTEFSFKISVAELDFHSLMTDISHKTNNLQGRLNGELTIVAGNTHRPNSWMGYGNVHLRDGVIWEIPVFGLFSPILNAIATGMGNSVAKQGVGEFLITNSVVSTKDFDIQATGMRMHFQGTVDFERRIESRVEAELLRDLPGIGLVLSKILWPVSKIFEYRVTGTLANPEAEPLYIVPKILLLPFQPFKVIKDMVTQDPKPQPDQPNAPE